MIKIPGVSASHREGDHGGDVQASADSLSRMMVIPIRSLDWATEVGVRAKPNLNWARGR
jgi:hypothetical protein